VLVGDSAGMQCLTPEILIIGRQTVRLQHRAIAVRIGADEQEVAVVRDKHLTIARPVVLNLLRLRDLPGILRYRLRFDGAPRRNRAGQNFSDLRTGLVFRKQPAVRKPGAGVLKVNDAAHLGPQLLSDFVEEVGQCRIV